jgi:polyphosphate kinase 2 (PPK2 family)
MGIEDHHPLPGLPAKDEAAEKEYRRYYFRELFRLQAELVKLQDWVAAREKIVIPFEGRDAAGEGCSFPRSTETANKP